VISSINIYYFNIFLRPDNANLEEE